MGKRKINMKTVSLFLVFLLVLNGCKSSVPKQYQVRSKATGRATNYLLNITTADKIGVDRITDWSHKVADTNGFSYFIYFDPDSWDAIIYLPKKQENIANIDNSNITMDVVDSVLKVYFNVANVKPATANTKNPLLIHFAAPQRGTWPGNIEVYWNDALVTCDGFETYD